MSDPRTTWSRAQRIKNDTIYYLARLALALAARMPRATLGVIGAFIGATVHALAGGARSMARANVQRALAALTPEQAAALSRRAFVELGRLLGDTLALLRADERPSRTLPFADDERAKLARARAAGRGVVLVTAHLGPWERLAGVLVEHGFPLTTPVRASYDPRLEAAVHARLRARHGVHALDRDAATTPIALLRALKRGEVVGMLIDVSTRVASARVPFLGVPAWTPVGPARLALRTGAPVVVAIATRAGVTVRPIRDVAEPCTRPTDDAVEALTMALNDALSEAIRAEPERWIWMHDRFGDRETGARAKALDLAAADSIEPSAGEI